MIRSKKQVDPAAVALRYRKNQGNAPVVIAKGKNKNAEKIIQLAQNNSIPIINNPELLHLLISIELDQTIPPEAFEAVAVIYKFLIEMDQKYERVLL
jgi:flagellar biosynthesis protein